jgi:hypothetical protein
MNRHSRDHSPLASRNILDCQVLPSAKTLFFSYLTAAAVKTRGLAMPKQENPFSRFSFFLSREKFFLVSALLLLLLLLLLLTFISKK